MATGNEAGARHLFDVLETLLILVCEARCFDASQLLILLLFQEVPILGKNIPDLVQFLLQCGADTSYDPELRVLALNALNWTVQ